MESPQNATTPGRWAADFKQAVEETPVASRVVVPEEFDPRSLRQLRAEIKAAAEAVATAKATAMEEAPAEVSGFPAGYASLLLWGELSRRYAVSQEVAMASTTKIRRLPEAEQVEPWEEADCEDEKNSLDAQWDDEEWYTGCEEEGEVRLSDPPLDDVSIGCGGAEC